MRINLQYIFLLLLGCSMLSCKSDLATVATYQKISGETMGTYYRITFRAPVNTVTKTQIDSLLIAFNDEVSTYEKEAIITRFNNSRDTVFTVDRESKHFIPVFDASKQFYEQSGGLFDPTVMPLVNYWGFGTTGKYNLEDIDNSTIDSLRGIVGFEQLSREGNMISRKNPNVQLDFSALAKGYGLDVVAQFLEEKQVTNYLVDIGGEAAAKGVNSEGRNWLLAITTPRPEAEVTDASLIVELDNKAIATSGNYRNSYTINGKVYGHSINPKTGFPESNVLSASVLAPDCMTADAVATTLMIMDLQQGKTFLKEHAYPACIMFQNEKDSIEYFFANDFEKYIIE